jgi:glutamine---fructose-6-phosphate transaminase (isomerizing)
MAGSWKMHENCPGIFERSRMFTEAGEAAAVVAGQLAKNAVLIRELGAQLRRQEPRIIYTCARGSSDHAATFAKYIFETRMRIGTVSQAPSISSVYGTGIRNMRESLFIVISQSGRSPDILRCAETAKAEGANVIAFVNDERSPLAEIARVVVPLHAGPETSVAATKSYIAALSAILHLVAEWSDDHELSEALATLGATLDAAWAADWSPAIKLYSGAESMFVLGRGLTLGIAQEAALKFKETCRLHAEAFSLAEVSHGPMALIEEGFPLLVFPPQDQAAFGARELIDTFAGRGAVVAAAGTRMDNVTCLPVQLGLHPAIAPLAMIQSFYRLVNRLAFERGLDPDRPPRLSKVTETR